MRAERRERAAGRAERRHLGSQALGEARPGARDASAGLDELPGAPAGVNAGVSSWNLTVRCRASPSRGACVSRAGLTKAVRVSPGRPEWSELFRSGCLR